MAKMQVKPVILVMVDISGYTQFLNFHRTSVLHAEEIISELLESVIDSAQYPLQLNKLEGDAIFLFTEITGKPYEVAGDVAYQVVRFFDAFKLKQQSLITHGAGGCPCDACSNIHQLQLKAFLHAGEAVFKTVKHFAELAGEDVILVHRLLKNSVPAGEYMLMTDAFYRLTGNIFNTDPDTFVESYEWLGEVTVTVFYPKTMTLELPERTPVTTPLGIIEGLRLSLVALWHRLRRGGRGYSHVPY